MDTLSSFWLRRAEQDRVEIYPTISAMITEWSSGETIPARCRSLIQRHEEATEIAQSIWDGAREIAPGVFQLTEDPPDERDVVVQRRLKHLYTSDVRARYVLERGKDSPATSLAYDEVLGFQRRLGVGESPEDILREVDELMQERNDRSCAVDIALGESRGRDPRDTLDTILDRAQYRPDPDAVRFRVLKASCRDLYARMVEGNLPIIAHDAVWICDVANGSSRPFEVSFQGQYLSAFLEMAQQSEESSS